MESHARKQLIVLALLSGINAVNVTEPGAVETVHGWQAALADRLGIAPNVLTHWLRRGNVPAKRAEAAEKTLGIERPQWYRYDLTERHLYNAAMTGDPDRAPELEEPEEEPAAGGGHRPGNKSSPEPDRVGHIHVADALTRTAHILESGTPYGRALYHNIITFDRALHNERKLEGLTSENERLNTRVEELEERQAEATKRFEQRLAALENPGAGRGGNRA